MRASSIILRRTSPWTAAAILGLALAGGAAMADGTASMALDEMKSVMIGNSLSGETESGDAYVEHYRPDGTIIGLSSSSGRYQGKWSFRQDGLMCFRYGDGAFDGGCVHLSRDGDRIGFTRVDGTTEPAATLIPGIAPQLK